MSQETPTRVAALKRGASHRPAGTFLAVFVTYSALVATVSYRTGRNSSGSEDIVYAWGPMISAGCWMRAFVTGSDNSGTHGFVATLFLAGTLEELGWRGFLQPSLQQRFDAVRASIGIGVTWVVRHVPMMVAGFGDFAAFREHTLNKRQCRSSTAPSVSGRHRQKGEASGTSPEVLHDIPDYFCNDRVQPKTSSANR